MVLDDPGRMQQHHTLIREALWSRLSQHLYDNSLPSNNQIRRADGRILNSARQRPVPAHGPPNKKHKEDKRDKKAAEATKKDAKAIKAPLKVRYLTRTHKTFPFR